MEQEIVDIALENLNRTTGIQAFWHNKGPLDGVLDLTLNGRKFTFVVEVKPEVRTHQLQQVEGYFHHHQHFMLVSCQLEIVG